MCPCWPPRLPGEFHHCRRVLQVISRSNVATAMAIEILRAKSPLAALFRVASKDTTVAGVSVPKGGRVIVNMRKVRMTHMHTDPHAPRALPM